MKIKTAESAVLHLKVGSVLSCWNNYYIKIHRHQLREDWTILLDFFLMLITLPSNHWIFVFWHNSVFLALLHSWIYPLSGNTHITHRHTRFLVHLCFITIWACLSWVVCSGVLKSISPVSDHHTQRWPSSIFKLASVFMRLYFVFALYEFENFRFFWCKMNKKNFEHINDKHVQLCTSFVLRLAIL